MLFFFFSVYFASPRLDFRSFLPSVPPPQLIPVGIAFNTCAPFLCSLALLPRRGLVETLFVFIFDKSLDLLGKIEGSESR